MLPAIENGFTFIAFLMFLAGGLLAMENTPSGKSLTGSRRWYGSIFSTWSSVPWACTIPKASVPLTAY